ncbi:MAG: BMP family ABC transporter substrate-binding protein [Clostridium butyricum]|nr:BMP family ABC transporter substrate-binding protein [Clostridium butyricum]
MKKKLLSALAIATLTMSLFAGCGSAAKTEDVNAGGKTSTEEKVKVGMVTDSGTIDDKSFNQGTWEGLKESEKDLGTEIKYLQPAGETEADYLKEIGNLYDAGYKFIVTPGFKFETAIGKAQDKYKDANFVIIDGEARNDAGEGITGGNTVAIYFAEQQSGFIAAIATAMQLKEGELGFIGGMEIPAVQKFNWGFQQGIAYANENLGTKMSLNKDNVVYQGTFSDSAAGQQLAAQMYDRGVKAIFCAAGGVGNGVITEAKTRVSQGDEIWVIGVDSDQYADGMLDNGKSVVLTSAVKKVDSASYNMIKEFKEGKFQGGKVLTFDITNDGVGIPEENPNLTSEDVMPAVNDVISKIKDGSIVISGEQGDLIK